MTEEEEEEIDEEGDIDYGEEDEEGEIDYGEEDEEGEIDYGEEDEEEGEIDYGEEDDEEGEIDYGEEDDEDGDQSAVEEESEQDPDRVCQNVPGIVPNSCEAFDCAIVKEVYDYSLTRVEEHNRRRRLHEFTADLKVNLDIACKAKEWSNH
jgi:hypothetical protein